VNAVFGVDIGTPAGRGGARFISHPNGFLGVSKRDDLAAVVLVAVPPYDDDAVAAFDRAGNGSSWRSDAAPPEESPRSDRICDVERSGRSGPPAAAAEHGFKRPERVPRRNGSTPTRRRRIVGADAIEFGIAVLDEQIGKADVSFPATAEEVRHALGDREIPYDGKGRTITLGEALDQVPQSRFENKTEFLDALYPVFDRKRREGGGLLTSLRDALPSDAARAAQRSRTGGPPLTSASASASGSSGPGVEAFDDIVYQHNVADGTDPAVRDDDARVPVDAPQRTAHG